MADSFTIMVFSWNASGLRFCSTMYEHEKPKGFFAKLTDKDTCVTPDFFEEIQDHIRKKDPDLVVMSTQDEDSSKTYFHAEFLEAEMSRLKYKQVTRDKVDDVGETASKNPYDPKGIPSGAPGGSALRISVYAKVSSYKSFEVEESKLLDFLSSNKVPRTFKCNTNSADTIINTGAIASYVTHPTFGTFVFIAAHLPLGTQASKYKKGMSYSDFRGDVITNNNLCLQQMKKKFLRSLDDSNVSLSHVFLMGDLGFDILPESKYEAVTLQDVQKYAEKVSLEKLKQVRAWDEINKEKGPGGVLEGFKEGMDGDGPTFLPTWRMARNRSEECGKNTEATSSTDAHIPITCFLAPNSNWGGFGWHDRILYRDIGSKSTYKITCQEYNRIDTANMKYSIHAGVIGLYSMKSI